MGKHINNIKVHKCKDIGVLHRRYLAAIISHKPCSNDKKQLIFCRCCFLSYISKSAPSPNSSSIQFVMISWSGKFKCTLLELDPVLIFPVSFCPWSDFICFIFNWISFHLFSIQKCVSLGPEEAIPKAKALFTNCLLPDETGFNVLLLSELDWEQKVIQKGVLSI